MRYNKFMLKESSNSKFFIAFFSKVRVIKDCPSVIKQNNEDTEI